MQDGIVVTERLGVGPDLSKFATVETRARHRLGLRPALTGSCNVRSNRVPYPVLVFVLQTFTRIYRKTDIFQQHTPTV